MVSCYPSENPEAGGGDNCTTASTFLKPQSLRFELLFGDYQEKMPQRHSDENIINAFDYIFSKDKIFGFGYESLGTDFKKLNHTFVLKSCSAGEVGCIIPGISPGAQILIRALTGASSMRLKAILNK